MDAIFSGKSFRMVKSCCVVGCKNTFEKGGRLSFYNFPADKELRSKWIAAVRRESWTPNESTVICSDHFVSGERSKNLLAPNSVPRLFSYVKSPEKRRLETELETFKRRQALKKRRILAAEVAEKGDRRSGTVTQQQGNEGQEECTGNEDSCSDMEVVTNETEPPTKGLQTEPQTEGLQTEPQTEGLLEITEELGKTNQLLFTTVAELLETRKLLEEAVCQKTDTEKQLLEVKSELSEVKNELSLLQKKNDKLNAENDKLRKRVVGESSLTDDDKAVKYYTGLPSYLMLQCIFDFVIVGLPNGFFASSCSPFEQFLMVLMKLRLNLGDQDLAYRFGIHQSTVSWYFNKWLDVLHQKLSVFVCWPERDQLMKTMPMEFRNNFRKCAIIIDCFEVFIERPTSLMARAQTWSNYKKHNTVKFLIGITPQGSIAYISKGWGGRVSDVHLTENCGLLKNLLPGDVILAD